MKLYEYQSKELFQSYGVPVPPGKLVGSPEAAFEALEELSLPVMVKAQILQGGRGKAGGIKRAETVRGVVETVRSFLGAPLKNERVRQVLIEETVSVGSEYYLGITIDDRRGQPVVVACSQGGMEIEELARLYPDKLIRHHVSPVQGLQQSEAMEIGAKLDLSGDLLVDLSSITCKLHRLFVEKDAQLAEINPLFLNHQGQFIAGDAKVIINDDALFRQGEFGRCATDELYDNEYEALAHSKGFNFVDLGGEIGVVSIGAGFGMMMLDVIAHYGCRPANFIDASGGISAEGFEEMVKLVVSKAEQDRRVKVILASCGIAATPLESIVGGLVNALAKHPARVPVLASFTADGPSTINMTLREAAEILSRAGIRYYSNLQEAIEAAVQTVRRAD